MASTVLTGGRRRPRTARPMQSALMLLAATVALLVALFVLWIAISLGANLIGDWVLLPIALGIALPMRRRMRDAG